MFAQLPLDEGNGERRQRLDRAFLTSGTYHERHVAIENRSADGIDGGADVYRTGRERLLCVVAGESGDGDGGRRFHRLTLDLLPGVGVRYPGVRDRLLWGESRQVVGRAGLGIELAGLHQVAGHFEADFARLAGKRNLNHPALRGFGGIAPQKRRRRDLGRKYRARERVVDGNLRRRISSRRVIRGPRSRQSGPTRQESATNAENPNQQDTGRTQLHTTPQEIDLQDEQAEPVVRICAGPSELSQPSN